MLNAETVGSNRLSFNGRASTMVAISAVIRISGRFAGNRTKRNAREEMKNARLPSKDLFFRI